MIYAQHLNKRKESMTKLVNQQQELWGKLLQSLKLEELWPGIFGAKEEPNMVRAKWIAKPVGRKGESGSVKYVFNLAVTQFTNEEGEPKRRDFSPDEVAPEFIPPNDSEESRTFNA